MLTPAQIANSTGATLMRATNWLQSLCTAMTWYEITTPARQAAFLAQIGEESEHLEYTREIWGPTTEQRTYEGRKDLGNCQVGDGYKYRGASLIETTGRFNFCKTRDGLRLLLPDTPDFEVFPELLEAPKWAALASAWFWKEHGCNELADLGDFETITRHINGGLNGYGTRCSLWACAKEAIPAS